MEYSNFIGVCIGVYHVPYRGIPLRLNVMLPPLTLTSYVYTSRGELSVFKDISLVGFGYRYMG